jgi:hypothetical protein
VAGRRGLEIVVSQIKFFTDEDVQRAVAEQLRAAGFDAISTPEAGRLGIDDETQLEWATQQARVLVSYNVADFPRIHYEWSIAGKGHSGIVVSTQRSIGDALRRLLNLGGSLTAEDAEDRLEYLSDW